jgi:hypothetical protein
MPLSAETPAPVSTAMPRASASRRRRSSSRWGAAICSRAARLRPQDGDAVRSHGRVGTDQNHALGARLGDEHSVEGVAVVHGELGKLFDVREGDRQQIDVVLIETAK